LSAFVIDKAHPGVSVARTEEKLGQKASGTCALTFEDQRIGAEGEGYKIPLSTLESGRSGSRQSVGMARAALEHAIGYFEEWSATGEQIAADLELAEERGRPTFLLIAARRWAGRTRSQVRPYKRRPRPR
jgi:butyryl-CoA dehydrogenase